MFCSALKVNRGPAFKFGSLFLSFLFEICDDRAVLVLCHPKYLRQSASATEEAIFNLLERSDASVGGEVWRFGLGEGLARGTYRCGGLFKRLRYGKCFVNELRAKTLDLLLLALSFESGPSLLDELGVLFLLMLATLERISHLRASFGIELECRDLGKWSQRDARAIERWLVRWQRTRLELHLGLAFLALLLELCLHFRAASLVQSL